MSHIHHSGSYREVDAIHVKHSGAWSDCDEVWVKSGGVWRQVFSAGFTYSETISEHTADYDLYDQLVSGGWNESDVVTATITINASIHVYSTNTANAGFQIDQLPAGSNVSITNNGEIHGMGGAGGAGSGDSGAVGGTAFKVDTQLSGTVIDVDNTSGEISGGGGGGGAGGATTGGKISATGAGGGGGFGRGGAAATGAGSPGVGTATGGGVGGSGATLHPGGNGGGKGATGSSGTGGSTIGPGGGGSGGNAVQGNSEITWTATGTRNGTVA